MPAAAMATTAAFFSTSAHSFSGNYRRTPALLGSETYSPFSVDTGRLTPLCDHLGVSRSKGGL
jgi:hypothetical protein